MRSAIFVFILSFGIFPCWSQLRLSVDGDGSISGNLTTNMLTASGAEISGDSPVRITTTGWSVLSLSASNPAIEFRNNSNDYLAFLQVFGDDLYLGNRQLGRLLLRTSNLDRMTITANGNIGIGTTVPASKLTINGPDNNGTIAGLEILSGAQKLIMDGNEIDATSGGLLFNYNSQNDVLLRTATRRAEVTMVHSNGNGTSNGIAIEHPGTNNVYWTLYATNADGNLELYYKGSLRGEFSSGTGAYNEVSDGRLKQKVKPLAGILERVAQLKPSSYSFRSDATNKTNMGFIAQEVQPLFPELVSTGKVGDTQEELLMLNYSGFGVIAIAAIQELLEREKTENVRLKTENQEMQHQISSLAERLDQLEYKLSGCCRSEDVPSTTQSGDVHAALSADRPHLAQNAPNPFRQETVIEYYLPATVEKAEIFLTDATGKIIRSFALDQAGYGKVTMEARMLSAGTYTYSLVIGGVIWQSLPMVVTK